MFLLALMKTKRELKRHPSDSDTSDSSMRNFTLDPMMGGTTFVVTHDNDDTSRHDMQAGCGLRDTTE
jgi:hypothetical protein